MSDVVENLVLRLAEEDFEDEDVDLVKEVSPASPQDVENWLVSAGFEKWKESWVKFMAQEAVSVAPLPEQSYSLSYYKRGGSGWVFSHRYVSNGPGLMDTLSSIAAVPVQEAEEEDFGDDDAFEFKDVLGPEDKHELYTFIKQGRIEIGGAVKRHSNHYVHENTTSVDLNVEFPLAYGATEQETEDHAFLQSKMEPEVTKLEGEINEDLRHWNKKIYRELEAAYEDYVSDDRVGENIEANEYKFDEDGNWKGDVFLYNELSPEAQARARDWWRENLDQNDWNHFSEPVIVEWKWLLKNKGFNDVKISWSGFSSQGDGASFTADSIDIEKYLTGPDPLTFPEQEREQLWENEDDDAEDLDVKDVYEPGRKKITHIATKSDYTEYQQRVAEFFAREGVNGLSILNDPDGHEIRDEFSRTPCEICHRPLAGSRVVVSGYNPQTKQVHQYDVCEDCCYYAEYGTLDDTTMMDLKDDPLEEAENEEDFDEVEFKEVDLDNPTHGMKAGNDRIWSQPATQYHEHFPENAWEIFVVRDAKPTKKDPRNYRSAFIGILIKTNDGWHTIVATPNQLSPPSETADQVVQQMFDQNKEYVWRGLGGN